MMAIFDNERDNTIRIALHEIVDLAQRMLGGSIACAKRLVQAHPSRPQLVQQVDLVIIILEVDQKRC